MLSLLVLEESRVDIILGHPWVALHQPHIRWSTGSIEQWSDYCFQSCLHALPVLVPKTPILESTTIDSPQSLAQVDLPEEYLDFQDVFSKAAATRLPPNQPLDCAIDFLHHTKLPKGHIYPLSILEQKAMEEYIQEALHQGFIRPSTSQLLLSGQKGWRVLAVY